MRAGLTQSPLFTVETSQEVAGLGGFVCVVLGSGVFLHVSALSGKKTESLQQRGQDQRRFKENTTQQIIWLHAISPERSVQTWSVIQEVCVEGSLHISTLLKKLLWGKHGALPWKHEEQRLYFYLARCSFPLSPPPGLMGSCPLFGVCPCFDLSGACRQNQLWRRQKVKETLLSRRVLKGADTEASAPPGLSEQSPTEAGVRGQRSGLDSDLLVAMVTEWTGLSGWSSWCDSDTDPDLITLRPFIYLFTTFSCFTSKHKRFLWFVCCWYFI